jgi:hypothetical protein
MWYYPTETVLRTHGCSLPINNGQNSANSQKENPAGFSHPTTAFTLYQVPVLLKVTNIGLQILVICTGYIFVTSDQYSLVGQVFSIILSQLFWRIIIADNTK